MVSNVSKCGSYADVIYKFNPLELKVIIVCVLKSVLILIFGLFVQ